MRGSLIERATAVLPGRSQRQIYCECRRCGTTVSEADTVCPSCGAEAIARLQLS
jgi:rubrerythrin